MIHLVLQGKGGVGKSVISAMIAQYLSGKKKPLICVDTDPVNSTFTGYKGLGVEVVHIQILEDNKVNSREFDKLIELIMANPKSDFVIDNGSSSFIPLSTYLYDNDAISLLESMGHKTTIHTPVTGGQAILDTLNGLKTLATQFDFTKGTSLVVWLNEYFGKIEVKGKSFLDMKVYSDNKDAIEGVITIPQQNEMFAQDVQQMLEGKLTYDEVATNDGFTFMAKNRIKIYKEAIFSNIEKVLA